MSGLLELSDTKAGLYIAGFLQNGMTSHEAESIAERTASKPGRWTG